MDNKMELGIELPLMDSHVLALWKQKNNPLHDIVNWDKNDRTFAWTMTLVNDNVCSFLCIVMMMIMMEMMN